MLVVTTELRSQQASAKRVLEEFYKNPGTTSDSGIRNLSMEEEDTGRAAAAVERYKGMM